MNFSSLDLNLLRVFDAMMREETTARAGARIGLSQPAVSAALARLRHALGDPLFVRQGQRLVPSDYAREIEIPVRETLERLKATLSDREFDPSEATHVFRISGIDYFSELLFPQLAQVLARDAPRMTVQHVDLISDACADMLERHNVDIALQPLAEGPDWIASEPLHFAGFTAIARRGNRRLAEAGIAEGDVIPLDLFCDMPHVLCSPDGKLSGFGDKALERVGRRRRVVMSVPFFGGVTAAVARTDHIALIPETIAVRHAPLMNLAIYRPPLHVPAPLIAMHWHRRATANPAHRWLRALIGRILRPLNPPGFPLPS